MSEPGEAVGAKSPWAPLSQPLFRALWIAAFVSNLGAWMQDVGEAWLMTSLTSSALLVSLLQTAEGVAIFLLALPAGALADIVDRRHLLIVTQAWTCGIAAAVGVVTLTGHATPALLIAGGFGVGLGTALTSPSWQAIVGDVVPREDLAAAITLNGVAFNLARAVGPAIGGLI
ncbi:MAG TPA: MFS transporter, partial [Thermoanaerobaculia bacterium]